MVILRCTKKLLNRLRVDLVAEEQFSSNLLGAWYANVFIVERKPYVICTNERSFLSVIVPFKESATIAQRFQIAVHDLFRTISIPESAIERELREMSIVKFGRTENRNLLGNMKELTLSAQTSMWVHPEEGLPKLAVYLSGYLIGPAPYRVPKELAHRLLCGAA